MVERRIFFGAHAAATEQEVAAGHDEVVARAVAKAEAAAATLEAIEAARRGALQKAQESLRKKGATSYQFTDDALSGELVNALPSVAPAPAGAAPPAKHDSEVVRKAHDDAMNVLQTH
jgi:hypothetical protein